MPIQLSHIGEDLIAAMLDSLANRGVLSRVTCAISGRSLADDIREGGLAEPIAFRADDAMLVIHVGDIAYACDGKQTVDVLCTGGEHAIAVEAKLGETRMGTAEFRKRFCLHCQKSKHSDSRLSGRMVAVLERSLPFEGLSRLVAQVDDAQWTLAEPWWLVVRQSVLDKWRKSNDFPVTSARILVFDALAKLYGSRQEFDQLVQRVVGANFAGRWGIPLNDP